MISRKWNQKGVPKSVKSEIAGLRHFLPRTDFLGIIFCVFAFFGGLLGASWGSLGRFWDNLGGILGDLEVKLT